MVRADEQIMRFMSRCDDGHALLTSKVIGANTSYSRQYVNKRLRNFLVPAGLVQNETNGLYRLTERGQEYLLGAVDPAELSNPT